MTSERRRSSAQTAGRTGVDGFDFAAAAALVSAASAAAGEAMVEIHLSLRQSSIDHLVVGSGSSICLMMLLDSLGS